MPLISETPSGLYCEQGDFYIDPWLPVARAIVTHAHSDHARWGCRSYLAARAGDAILRMRLGGTPHYDFVGYGEVINHRGVRVSLHPSGHMTGGAQVRLEADGEIVVVSGDYKLQEDATCAPFEPLRCDLFVTESTFGLPIYRWQPSTEVIAEIEQWWLDNQQHKVCSVLFAYTVGKAQRLLSAISPSLGPFIVHGAILGAVQAYRNCGVTLPKVMGVQEAEGKVDWATALVVAPPSARGSVWLRRFGEVSLANASGWMQIRGIRRRQGVDRGFVMSDHVDWLGLQWAIAATEASEVWVTHGYTRQVVQHLSNRGIAAREVHTEFRGELAEEPLEKDESMVEGVQGND